MLIFILYYACITYTKAGIQKITTIFHTKKKLQGRTPAFTRITQQIRRYFQVPTETKAKYHFFGATVASIALMVGLIVGGWQIYKAVFALTETTTTMPTDVEFNRGVSGALASYLDDEGKIEVASSSVKLAKVTNWWNENYKYRKQITLKNLSSASISTSSAQITIDTKALVDAGKLLANCNDLRMAKLATSGATMAEQPRSLTPASGATNCGDSTATIVGFSLNETYAANATSSAYFLYYGNSSATAPSSYPREKYLSFDGGDFVKTPLHLSTWTSKTYAAWVYFSVNHTWDIIAVDGGAFDSNKYAGLTSYDGKLTLWQSYNSGGATYKLDETTQSLLPGRWNHVAGTIDKTSGVMRIFVNGQKIKESTQDMSGVNFYDSQNTFLIGGGGIGTAINGNIEDVFVYNRALSSTEILALYNNQIDYNDISLKLAYQFNEMTGQTITDSSIYGQYGNLGINTNVGTDDPIWTRGESKAYSLGTKNATMVCPFNGTTTCTTGQTPTSATGAIRYATGSAIKFDGKNDSISLSSIPSITTPYTVSLWFNPSKTAQNGALLSLHGGNNYPKFVMTASGKLLAYAGNEKYKYGAKAFSTSDLNKWWHAVFVIPNSSDLSNWKIYINGVDDTGISGANTGSYYEPSSTGYIGTSNQGEYFNGLIDEVAVFNGAYSQDQVTALYNNGAGKVIEPESNLKLLYHFDENGDDPRNTGKVIDASGNGNHGTITGAKYTNDSPLKNGSYASHEGIFIEEGTTNLIANPSFENASATLNWGPSHFTYATGSATFTPSMAKRNSAGPFAAGPIIQSNINTSTAGDLLRASGVGTTISGDFNSYFDFARGTIQFWITPEWNGNDGARHMLLADYNGVRVEKTTSNTLSLQVIKKGVVHSIDVSSWTAGTTYLVSLRWDTINPIASTNYACITINDAAPSCGDTDVADATLNGNVLAIGSYYEGSYSASAIIEGLTIYRRVLYDGLYGTDVGNGDEINLIYSGGTGKDPTQVTGSWDVVFALPTNAATGALVTGTGNAWSMPHSSNLLGGSNGANGFMMNGNAATDGFTAFAPNKLVNSTFDTDLNNWTATPSYTLNDQFISTPTTLVNGGLTQPVPILGSDILTNGSMETGNPPTGWVGYQSAVLTSMSDERTGGSGMASLDIARSSTNYPGANNDFTTVDKTWYSVSGWSRNIDSQSAAIRPRLGSYSALQMVTSSTSWVSEIRTGRSIGTSSRINLETQSTAGSQSSRYDDITVKPLTISSLFTSTNTATSSAVVAAGVTLTAGTQAGVVMNLDSDTNPQNFIIAYHDGTNAHLEKVVAGTYTSLINTAATYIAGATLKVSRDSAGYALLYNGTQIGTTQNITDAGIISNTRHGLFSTYASNSFTGFTVATTVNGSYAEPTGGMRTVIDASSALSISGGTVSLASGVAWGDPGLRYPSTARAAGKILTGTLNFSSANSEKIFGFSSGTTGTLATGNGFYFYNGNLYYWENGNTVQVAPFVANTDYQFAIDLRSSGAYYFVKGGIYASWTLVWVGSQGSVATLYPALINRSASNTFTADNVRMPTSSWLPTPLAYDTFTRADGAIGNTEATGPDSQTIQQLSWTGSTWEVSSNSIKNTPTLGSEILTNGNFTNWTGDNPDSWGLTATEDGSHYVTQNPSGQVQIVDPSTSILLGVNQSFTTTPGTWYQTSVDIINNSGSGLADMVGGYTYNKSAIGSNNVNFRATGTGYTWTLRSWGPTTTTIDNASIKPLTLSSLFSSVSTSTSNFIADADITYTAGTQGGLVTNLDSTSNPQNFVIAYLGANTSYNTSIYLEKVVAGTYTTLINTTVTYSPGAQLRVIKNGTSYRVYYNNAQVGSEQTISDAGIINNTLHGLFSTSSSNTFDNFTLFPRSGYTDAPFEELTVTRDTITKYVGASSVKLVAGGVDANYIQSVNVGDTQEYTFTAYAYTTGAAVIPADLDLYYDTATLSSTITSTATSGWYKLTGSFTGVASPKNYGVRIKAGKTVYLDSMSVQATSGIGSATTLGTAQKIFAGGYAVAGGLNEGMYKDITVTAGQDLVIRGVAHSDGVSQPKLILYDQTNDVEIGSLTGTTTSTRAAPNVLLFTGEAPSGCTTVRVKLVNAIATNATVNWHQVEVYNNAMTNPSMEGGSGDPWVPTGWTNAGTLGAVPVGGALRETTIVHSGANALKMTASTAALYGMNQTLAGPTGKFYGVGGWFYNGIRMSGYNNNNLVWQSVSSGAIQIANSGGANWTHVKAVGRVNPGGAPLVCEGNTTIGYCDDMYAVTLDPISLTATPATQANSTETNGLRVDGADTLTQPITGLTATNGVIKFKFTPRYDWSVSSNFGSSALRLFNAYGDATNYIDIYRDNGNGRLTAAGVFNGTNVTASWASTVLNAGITYTLELNYTAGGNLILKINGTQVANQTGVVPFTFTPNIAYFGTYRSVGNTYDATYTSFVTSSATENSTSPYNKFGSKSIKIQSFDAPDQYVTTATASANAAYTLSAYVYDGTASNAGGVVDASVAQLASGSASLTTTYTDMGGGWWRLSHTTATIPAGTYNFGVEVKAGKTIYFDGVQMEQKAYSTTYVDGSLGSGYTWSGTTNASTSTRAFMNLTYPASGLFGVGSGSISMWVKPSDTSNIGGYLFRNDTGPGGNWFLSHNSSSVFMSVNDISNVNRGNVTKSTPINVGNWYHIFASWDNPNQQLKVCVNNSCSTGVTTGTYAPFTSTFTMTYTNYEPLANNSTVSDMRAFDQPLSATEIADIYNQGLMTHQSAAETADRYAALGTYTSPVVDLGANGQWGGVPIAFSQALNGGTVVYSTRTSADNSIWSSWETVSGSTIASLPRRYMQWKADITPSSGAIVDSPVISGMTVKYVEDTTPPVNPSAIALGYASSATASANLISGTWYNHATPKFAWDSADDAAANGQSASGIDSYYAFFTQDSSATPSANIADNCFRQTTELDRSITIGTTPALCSLTDGTYYLRLQSKDNSGNISDPVTMFTYKYDGSIPNAPASVSTTSVGYTSNNAFTFFWPAATDNGPSGVSGYEYKTGTSSGAFADWVFTSGTTATDVSAYQEGQNFFLVRTVDTSGNVSGNTSNNVSMASFYYNASAPTQPKNVNITPETSVASSSASNVFTVTWDKPATYSGEIAKYYYCVNCTPALNAMTETTAAETVNRTLSNIALATQQGKNTLFIVAEDNNTDPQSGHGNRNFDAYSSTDFYASTIAPAAPTSLVVSDASDRDAIIWRLTLTWKAPATGGTPKIYQVYRAEGTGEYVKLGETTSTAYTDADLTQSTKYSYKVRAVDNAGSLSLFSAIVTRSPEGKYTAPPTNGGVPASSPGSTTALIKWSTSRTSFGTVEYGKTTTYGSAATETDATKDHVVKLTGLSPGVTYHYRVQSLDDSSMVDYNRVDAYSSDYSFTTLNTASVTAIEVTDIGLDSAVVAWKTTSLATSKVEYGPTLNYGKSIDISSSASESAHTTRLSGLSHSTVYHFRVSGTTSDGDDIFSQDNVFQTLIFPKVTALVMNTDQEAAGTTVVLAWSTNVPTTGEVMYQAASIDTTEKKIDLTALQNMTQAELATVPVIPKGAAQILYTGELETKHIQRVTGLTDGSIYIFTIRGRDEKGNQAVSDPIRYVTGADTRPPTLQNIIIETPMTGVGTDAKAQIIISWDTDEPSTSQVLWGSGTGSEYPQATEKETALGTKHVVVLRDLQPTSSYHLKIISNDKTGNSTESKDTVVVTPSSQQAAFDIIIKNLEDVFGFLKL